MNWFFKFLNLFDFSPLSIEPPIITVKERCEYIGFLTRCVFMEGHTDKCDFK